MRKIKVMGVLLVGAIIGWSVLIYDFWLVLYFSPGFCN